MRLPKIKYTSAMPRYEQISFRGIDRRKSAIDGSIHDLVNISTDEYPLLVSSRNRYKKDKKILFTINGRDVLTDVLYYGMADKPFAIFKSDEDVTRVPKLWQAGVEYDAWSSVRWQRRIYTRNDTYNFVSDAEKQKFLNTPPPYASQYWRKSQSTFQYDSETEGYPCDKGDVGIFEDKAYRAVKSINDYYYNNGKNWEKGTVEEFIPGYKGYWSYVKVYYIGDVVIQSGIGYRLIKEEVEGEGTTKHDPEEKEFWEELGELWKVFDISNTFKAGDLALRRDEVESVSSPSGSDICYRNITGVNFENAWEPYSVSRLVYDSKAVAINLDLDVSEKECAYINGYIVIYPDKVYFNTIDRTYGYLSGTRVSGFNLPRYNSQIPKVFADGKQQTNGFHFYLTDSERWVPGATGRRDMIAFGPVKSDNELDGSFWNNMCRASFEGTKTHFSFAEVFKPGDAIKISSSGDEDTEAEIVGGYYIVREVYDNYMIFDSGVFAGANLPTLDTYTIEHTDGMYSHRLSDFTSFMKYVPDLDYLCTVNNRVWGCKDNTVYASALGNCFTWQNYTGIESDAVFLEAGTIDTFTACYEYNGAPYFFKEHEMYRVYGSSFSTFSLQKVADIGVKRNSPHSICCVNSIMIYLSPKGVFAYAGGVPGRISEVLGGDILQCEASTDGMKYYAIMTVGNEKRLYIYDTANHMWFSETIEDTIGFAWHENELKAMCTDGSEITVSTPSGLWGTEITKLKNKSVIEFNDFYEGDIGKKDVGRVLIRTSVDPRYGALDVLVQYDSDGVWHKMGSIYNQDTRKRVSEFGFFPRRCDHYRIRLECKGKFVLYSIARQVKNN